MVDLIEVWDWCVAGVLDDDFLMISPISDAPDGIEILLLEYNRLGVCFLTENTINLKNSCQISVYSSIGWF